MTAVEWLVKIYLQTNKIDSFDIEQAKEMEKAATISKKEMVEISDEEIEKASKYIQTTNPDLWTFKIAWKAGAKWYREQLKKNIFYNDEYGNPIHKL